MRLALNGVNQRYSVLTCAHSDTRSLLPITVPPNPVEIAPELACFGLLDNNLARAHARNVGATSISTGGLLIAAKAERLIPVVGPLREELQNAGYYFSELLAAHILELAEEG